MHASQMKSGVVVVLGAVAYYALALTVLPWASRLAPAGGGYPALQLANTLVLVALSIPFALLLASPRLSLKAPVLVALGIALLGLVAPSLSSAPLVLRPGVAGASAAADFVKFALALPLVTWLAVRWLPSHYSIKPQPLRGPAD